MFHAGWDWASQSHDLAVVDDGGQLIDSLHVAHSEPGLARAIRWLVDHDVTGVAIERPKGVEAQRMLDAGLRVVPIPPKAFWATRPRWSASGAKSDAADAFMLADLLRTDGHRFRALKPMSVETAHLHALSRARVDQLQAKTAAMHRLRALLNAHWPGPVGMFKRLDADITLAFLHDYPTPESAERLGEARMAMFCRRHGYSGRSTPAELLERLRDAPVVSSTIDPDVLTELVRTHARLVATIKAGIADLDGAVGAALLAHPKAKLFRDLPRAGDVSLGSLIGELGPILERVETLDQACAEAGVSPVTRESGKGRSVSFRQSSNKQARRAMMLWANNSRHDNDWAADVYDRARARGKRHPHAVRILARAWVRVLWACWHNDVAYDPTRHERPPQQAA